MLFVRAKGVFERFVMLHAVVLMSTAVLCLLGLYGGGEGEFVEALGHRCLDLKTSD